MNMKNNLIKTISILFLPIAFFAQSGKVQSAWRSFSEYESSVKDGKPDLSYLMKAKENIDLAQNHPDTKDKPKTLSYVCKIYYALFNSNWEQEKKKLSATLTNKSQIADEAYGNVDTTEFSIAAEAMTKVFNMESKEKEKTYSMELGMIGLRMFADMQNLAIGRYKVKKFSESMVLFRDCYDANKFMGKKDTLLIQNALLSAEKAKLYDKVIEIGKLMQEDKVANAETYNLMYYAHLKRNDFSKAEATLNEGLSSFPNDKNLIINYIDVCLQQKKESAAMQYVDKAIEKDPKNCALYLVKGNVFDNQANPKSPKTGRDTTKPSNFNDLMTKAEENYIKAVACGPNVFDYNFNLGAVYNNWGNWYSQNANGSNSADYDAKSQMYWKKAIEFLEKCSSISQDDKSIKKNLIRLYKFTNQQDKANALSDQIKK